MSTNFDPSQVCQSDVEEAAIACMPFALAERWAIPSAYERSIKLSAQGVFANRYLLGFATRDLKISDLLDACAAMGLSHSAQCAIGKRFPKSLTTFIGYEQAKESTFLKVYLGFEPTGAHRVLSHIGWKWNPREIIRTKSLEKSYRVSLYRRRGYKKAETQSKTLPPLKPAIESLRILVEDVLYGSWDKSENLYLTEVTEAGGRNSVDWNIYASGLTVGHFADQLCTAFATCGSSENEARRFLELDSECLLGHLAYGRDWNANGFCTLYFSSPGGIGQ